jgi:hypothetical protein
VLERLLRQAREQLLVLGVGAGEAAFHIVETEPVEQSGDPLLVRSGKRNSRTLRAVAQGGVVHHDFSGGHKKTSRPYLAGRSTESAARR